MCLKESTVLVLNVFILSHLMYTCVYIKLQKKILGFYYILSFS